MSTKRTSRKALFTVFGIAIAFIAVTLWTSPSVGATFQPVPNQVLDLHWGMSFEDASKVRTMMKMTDLGDKFEVHGDTQSIQNEVMGMVTASYVFMNGRLVGAFLKFHCINDVMIYLDVFRCMYGTPISFDEDAGKVVWESRGNRLTVDLAAEVLIMGIGVVMDEVDGLMKKEMENMPAPENVVPDTNVQPKTES